MQTTIALPSSHPLRAMTTAARQIALPGEYSPERYPSFPALERTAVMGFNAPTTLPLTANTSVHAMVARQAAWPVWADQTYTGTLPMSYQLSYPIDIISGTGTIEATTIGTAPVFWSAKNTVATATTVGSSNAQAFYHPYPVVGVDNEAGPMPFVFLPNNSSLYIVLSYSGGGAQTATQTCSVTLEGWSAPGEVNSIPQNTVSVAIGNCSGASTAVGTTNPSGNWIRPKFISDIQSASGAFTINLLTLYVVVGGTGVYTNGVSTMGSFALTQSAGSCFLPLVYPVEFANSTLPWYSTRVTAAAMLGTNVTQVLNKAGTVLGGRVAPAVLSPWAVTQSYVNGLHPAEKAWLPLETGVYTYAPPSTDLVNFWDYTLNTTGGCPSCPVYRLDNDSLINHLYLTAGSVAESLAVTASWHLEFRTSSSLFQIALSGMPIEMFHQTQLALAAAGFFFENPEHKSVLQRIIAGVHKIAPSTIKAIGAVHPGLGAVAKAAYQLIKPKRKKTSKRSASSGKQPRKVQVPQRKMEVPATSAQRSGFNGPKRKSGLQMYLDSRR